MELFRPIFYGQEFEWDLDLSPEEAQIHLLELHESSTWWERPIVGQFRKDHFVLSRPLASKTTQKS